MEHILSEHEAGVSVRELARRYEPSATTIQNWKRQAKAKASESEPGESEVAQLRRLQRRNQELEQENAFLKKSGSLVCRRQRDPAWWNRAYELIEAERKNFAIRLMCRVLEISESGYYAWRNRKPMKSYWRRFVVYWSKVVGLMGAPRIAAQLCKSGVGSECKSSRSIDAKGEIIGVCSSNFCAYHPVARVVRTV